MKSPTVAKLYNSHELSVKAAVPRRLVKDLIPQLRAVGATDILETDIRKVVP
jgi:ATP phosphoribosyltransferase